MAFIRGKKHRTKDGERIDYAVVQNYREEGRVRQQIVAYLGSCTTVEDAIRSEMRHMLYQQRWHEVHQAKWQAEFETLSKSGTLEHAQQVLSRRYGGSYYKRWARRMVHLDEALTELPGMVADCEAKLARLRAAADLLGITDPEALLLPDTDALAALHIKVEEKVVKNLRFWAGIARMSAGLV